MATATGRHLFSPFVNILKLLHCLVRQNNHFLVKVLFFLIKSLPSKTFKSNYRPIKLTTPPSPKTTAPHHKTDNLFLQNHILYLSKRSWY